MLHLLFDSAGCYIYEIFLDIFVKQHIFADLLQWGCFGFDSIRHWTVSTPGVGGLPVNLSFQTISWQQLLRTRCLVYQVERLNLRGQGCSGDEYPDRLFRLFCPVKWGIISNGLHDTDSAECRQAQADKLHLARLPAGCSRKTKDG